MITKLVRKGFVFVLTGKSGHPIYARCGHFCTTSWVVLGVEARPERVEGARADVAVHDAEGGQ
jgi:hypothetical protein